MLAGDITGSWLVRFVLIKKRGPQASFIGVSPISESESRSFPGIRGACR